MKLRGFLGLVFAALLIFSPFVIAQVDTVIGQFTNSSSESFVGGISGDGAFSLNFRFEEWAVVLLSNKRMSCITDDNRSTLGG